MHDHHTESFHLATWIEDLHDWKHKNTWLRFRSTKTSKFSEAIYFRSKDFLERFNLDFTYDFDKVVEILLIHQERRWIQNLKVC